MAWVWGIVALSLGFGFLFDAWGYINFRDFFLSYWPGVLILVGIIHLFSERYFAGLAWVVVGVILGLFTLHAVNGDIWQALWPLVLILIGLRILLRPKFKLSESSDSRDSASSSAIFGAANKKITSKNFRSATITAIFGGAKIDLRGAEIAKGGATIDVDAIFGGVEILVPDKTKIRVDVFAAFGGHDDKREVSKISDKGPEILVRGNAIFGGVEIKN